MKNPQNIHQRCSNWQPMALMAALVTLIAAPLRAAESVETADPPGGSSLLAALARVAGEWVNAIAAGGVAWGHLLMGILCLLLVAVGVQVLRWVLRRAAKRNETTGTGPDAAAIPWAKLVIEAVIPPLTLFVWAWGVYAAIMFVFAQMAQPSMVLSGGVRWLKNAGEIGAAFWFVFRLIRVVEVRLQFWTARTENKWDDVLVTVVVRALRLVVPLVAVILLVPTLDLPAASNQFFKQAAGLLLIGAVGFILFQLVQAVEEAVLRQFRIDVKDNLEARKVYTQVKVLKKIAVVLIVIFTAASMLMVFDSVRQLGTSILASAGVLGIIIGFAAQRSIATVLAGFQIAMTQPIRLDDVVIVEGEWGRIEEITLTYVVVRIWDQRRLVLPINYFIEKPFQNWTRVSAELLGTVFLHTDYTVPLGPLREELDRVLAGTNLWDGRVKLIQVTDAKERTLELRVLVSAADAPTAWDLRCLVREKLVDFLQRHQPGCLPRLRAELWGEARPSSNAIA